MEPVTVKMNAGDLKGIIDLPNYPDDQPVNITISPDNEKISLKEEDVKKILRELAGCLSSSPDKNKSLKQIRYERIMGKYESLN